MTSLTDYKVSELRKKLDSREVSSKEVTEAFLGRIEKTLSLNSFIEITRDKALEAASAADRRIASGEKGKLLGIPVGIKDLISTKGIRTTCGSKILHNYIPPYDATVVSKLKNAGAVIVGKNNLDEFAMGSTNKTSFFGPAKNPWNPEYVPGGSSGGGATAVAARQVPISLGTDTGGSIRQPASFCGIAGLKPTYGRVSRYGVVAYASSLDQVGAFGRDVTDCAWANEAISGYDSNDSTSVNRSDTDFSSKIGKEIKGLRIGVPKEYFVDGMAPEAAKAVKDAITQLVSLGAEIVDISLPHTEHALSVYYILATAEASSNLARFDGIRYGHRAEHPKGLQDLYCRSRSEGFGDEVRRRIIIGTYVLSSGYYDAYYGRAQKVRSLIVQDFQKAFEKKCDLILSPTAPTGPFKIEESAKMDPLTMYLNDIFTIPINLAGLPAMSIPCGFDNNDLPLGLQLIGKPWDEATIFQVGHAYESSTEWHHRSPKE